MEVNKDVVNELNAFLKGQYMGIHAYETYIAKAKDPTLRNALQTIQQAHKRNAARVAERIQDLGGSAADDEGLVGSIQQTISKFMIPDTDKGLIEGAIFGEDHFGIDMSSEIVKGDLDAESMSLVKDILAEDRTHVALLKGLLH